MSLEKLINPIPVILSIGIAFMGSYATVTMYEQFRLCSKTNRPKLLGPNALLFFTALCLGGVAVWTMHFVGLASVRLVNPETNETEEIYYSDSYLIISLIVIIIMGYTGLLVASSNKIYTKDKADAIEDFILESKNMSIEKIREMKSKFHFLRSILLEGMVTLVLGGVIAATGVCIMHYIGMEGMVFNAHIEWNYGIVAASVIIALVAATAAFWILFRLLSLFPYMESLRILCSVIMCIAVNGMHYTGMAAASFVYKSDGIENNKQGSYVGQQAAMFSALAGASILISFVLMLTIADLRSWYYNLSGIMYELDRVAMKHIAENNQEAFLEFIHFYLEIRREAIDQDHAKEMIKQHMKRSDSFSNQNANVNGSLKGLAGILPSTDDGNVSGNEKTSVQPNSFPSSLSSSSPGVVTISATPV